MSINTPWEASATRQEAFFCRRKSAETIGGNAV